MIGAHRTMYTLEDQLTNESTTKGERDWMPGEEERFNEKVDERLEELINAPFNKGYDRDFPEVTLEDCLWEDVRVTSPPHFMRIIMSSGPEDVEEALQEARRALKDYLRPQAEDWVRDHP
ncbi:hypothetical protein DRQ50_11715 [bacterium]|nr:MAG: hypothetical protein DRQ50_11715 [bacterium]